jgi:hypothetical protein
MSDPLNLEAAFADFERRVSENKTRKRIDPDTLRVGDQLHHDCAGCGADMVREELDFSPKQEHCENCLPLVEAGVLADFKKRMQQETA